MTDKRKARIGGFYWANQEGYPTITTILRVIDKSGPLMWWAAGQAYDALMESIVAGDPIDRATACKAHKGSSDIAKDRGTTVHSMVEAWGNTGKVPGVDSRFKMYAEAFQKFLKDFNPEPIDAERTVWSKKHRYAGTCDNLFKIDGRIFVNDVKTGKDLYPEVQLQVAAAKQGYLEGWVQPERFGELVEGPCVEADELSALLLKDDGTYKFETYRDKLPAFLAAKTLYEGINQERLEKVGYL